MIDQADILVTSGNGGDGSISGRREKYVPRGGPDGGNGGDGGSVILRADRNMNTLLEFRYKRSFEGASGGPGLPALKHGANGKDAIVTVPVGTQVYALSDEKERGELIVDLDQHGRKVIVARGGVGGRGNATFATSVNQFPLLAESGEPGEKHSLRLELKLLADVGLVGLPNAGKSSLLAAVSAARPKVAAYPFTTLEPVLGVVEHLGADFLMVDIPGLIEGAHEGVGLGHDFLRHVERTRVLVHVIDGSAKDPVRDGEQIAQEIALFDEQMAAKPRIVALNKMDIPEALERADEVEKAFRAQGMAVARTSAAARTGLKELLDLVVQLLDRQSSVGEAPPSLADRLAGKGKKRRPEPEPDAVPTGSTGLGGDIPVIRPEPMDRRPGVTVRDGVFVIDSSKAARMAVMVDPESWPAKQQFYAHLRRLGIVDKLEELGIKTGDTVQLGDAEWEWS